MLYDELVAGGRNPQGQNVRRMLYDVHDEPVVGGRNPVIQILKRGEYVKSLEHQICKVKKETVPRRRYGPKVRMYGGCYTMYTMYTRNPSWGGGTPGGTPG